jgi:hypothetical protein
MARTFDETPFKKLRKPTDDEYKSIASALKLTAARSEALQRCVNSIVADCKRYYAEVFPRLDNKAMQDKADDIYKLLAAMEREVKRAQPMVDKIVPLYGLGALGHLLSFEAIAKIDETNQTNPMAALKDWEKVDVPVRPLLERLEADELRLAEMQERDPQPITMLKLEHHHMQPKLFVDYHGRSKVLLHIIAELKNQFGMWQQEKKAKKDKGGGAFDEVRRHFIDTLACHTLQILGEPVKKSGGVAFVRLCTEVFTACGLETDTLDTAVRNHLKIPSVWKKVSEYNGIAA